MRFTTGTISRCAGQNHYHLPVTVGGRTVTLTFTLEEIGPKEERDFEETREQILDRLGSALIESGATTLAQRKAALENKTFEVR